MIKPTVLYYAIQDFQEGTLDFIRSKFDIVTLPDPGHDTVEILEEAHVIIAPMGYSFDKNKIDIAKKLQVIGSPTTSTAHIDVDYAKQKNIVICSLQDQQVFLDSITPTAELTWGLILSVIRWIPDSFESVCQGEWSSQDYGKQTPRMLSKMSIGIIGLGRLGRWVAKYAKAFQMDVYYYDPFVSDAQLARCEDLYELARKSDIVTVHVHISKDTKNLIDNKFISAMKKGSYIFNTSRGGIVNESDLLEGLLSGHLAGAGLDMLEGEHLPGFCSGLTDNPLIKYAQSHNNLIITPKIGGCTVDAWEITERRVVELVIEELKKRGTINEYL